MTGLQLEFQLAIEKVTKLPGVSLGSEEVIRGDKPSELAVVHWGGRTGLGFSPGFLRCAQPHGYLGAFSPSRVVFQLRMQLFL